MAGAIRAGSNGSCGLTSRPPSSVAVCTGSPLAVLLVSLLSELVGDVEIAVLDERYGGEQVLRLVHGRGADVGSANGDSRPGHQPGNDGSDEYAA